jgi:outer membrane biosynthesis protein TonB
VRQWLKKFDKTLAASILLHVMVIGWGIMSFSARSLEAKPQESMPVDIISADQLSQITKGMKNGDKKEIQQMAEKVADAKPVDDAVGKILDKKPVITPTSEQTPPKPDVPDKPKDDHKRADNKDDQKIDPIAEQLKKDQAKPPPKPEVKQAPKPKERPFDRAKIAALLDKRDPTRSSITGEQLNPKSALGTAAGAAQKLTLSWVGALQRRISDCWNVPSGIRDAENIEIRIYFELNADGTVAGRPLMLAGPPTAYGPAVGESAVRAIEQCQPYTFLPQAEYRGGWDKIDMTFSTKEMFRR